MYSRTLTGGQEVTLAASGWTYQNTFVLYDQETESMWFPGVGLHGNSLVCVSGELQDMSLPVLPHQRTIWRSWVAGFGESLLMIVK